MSLEDLKSLTEEATTPKSKLAGALSKPTGAMRFKEVVKRVQDSEEVKGKTKRAHLWLDLKELTFTALGYRKSLSDQSSSLSGKIPKLPAQSLRLT